MTERRLGIMIFSGHFYAQNLDFHGGAEFETIPWGGGRGTEFGTIPPELQNVTDIADISV